MKILITGSSGFVGRYVLQELGNKCSTTDIYPLSFKNIKFREGVLPKVDVVIHLAALKSGEERDMLEVNAFKVKEFLKYCKGAKHFVYISTEFIEAFNSAYTRSKRIGEIYVQTSGLNYTIIRLPHMYADKEGLFNSKLFTKLYKLMKNVQGVKFRSEPENVKNAAENIVEIIGDKRYFNKLLYLKEVNNHEN